jgi:cytoskeleton protein RodZ
MNESAALPGARLKAERERRGLSAQKAADEMHLDRWVIDALEADDYTRIGAAVYAKGHLKKYAALLGLPVAEILASYESRGQARSEPTPPPPSILRASRTEAPASNLSSAQIGAFAAVGVLLLGVLLWRPWHHRVKAAVSSPPTAAAPAPASPDKTIEAGLLPSATASPAMARDTPAAGTTTGAVPAGAAAPIAPVPITAAAPGARTQPATTDPVPGAGRARLRLSFSADSWVDVHDATGRRTFAGNGLANSVKTITGMAPMRVYLGFGSGVQLEINDRAVAIGPQFFAGDVARFEAGADGVLRRESRAEPTRTAQPHDASQHD